MHVYHPCHPINRLFVTTFQREAQILVVEDDLNLHAQLCSEMQEASYRVVSATNDHEALFKFEQEAIDLVLLNVMTPSIDGFALCQSLRRRSNVPIITMTAHNRMDQTIRSLDLGADDSIAKPFTFVELAARVEALLRRTQMLAGTIKVQRSHESLN